jgi:hypothetical protein
MYLTVVALCETPIENAPYSSCQAEFFASGKFSWSHFEDPDFSNWMVFATEIVLGKESNKWT